MPLSGVIAEDGVTRTAPQLQKRRPSGSTSHHFPSRFSVRKRPVAFSCGPAAQPPYLFQPAGPGCAARSFSSFSATAFSSASECVFPGHSRYLNWPYLSKQGRKSFVAIFVQGSFDTSILRGAPLPPGTRPWFGRYSASTISAGFISFHTVRRGTWLFGAISTGESHTGTWRRDGSLPIFPRMRSTHT